MCYVEKMECEKKSWKLIYYFTKESFDCDGEGSSYQV